MTQKMSRREFMTVAAWAAASAILAACNKRKAPAKLEAMQETLPVVDSTPLKASPAAQEPSILNFWGWTDPAWAETINQYPEQNPRVKVNIFELGNTVFGDQKFLVAVAAGTGPDVAIQNRHTFLQFAARKLYSDVTSYFNTSDLKKTDFTPVQINEMSWDNKIFGLPLYANVRYLYWNKKQFDEAGLDPDKPPTTWAELEDHSEKLNVKDDKGEFDRIGFVPYLFGNSWIWLYGFLNKAPSISQDKRTILCDDPKWSDALDWMVKFYDAYIGSFELANTFGESITAAGLGDPFAAGKVSMTASGDWQVGDFLRIPELDWDCAPMPIPPGGERSTWSCGWSVVMAAQSNQGEAAFDFMKWLVTEPGWEARAAASAAETKSVWEREKIAGEAKFWPTQACYQPALKMLGEKYVTQLGDREQKAWAMGLDALLNWNRGCGAEMGVAALEYWVEMDNVTRAALSHALGPKEAMAECKKRVQQITDRAWQAIDALG